MEKYDFPISEKTGPKKVKNGIITNLENIKSTYILSKILGHFKKEKALKIIKYNKNVQNKLNITIDDFKEISQTKIIVIPCENKFGKFINIFDKKMEKYYHIYFNDNKEEIKRNYLNENDKATKIKIAIDYNVQSLYGLFFNCTCIESIDFIKSHGANINNIKCMFASCRSLKKISFYFKSKNLSDMSYMFSECSLLEELNISNFDTDKFIKMEHVFYKCPRLKVLSISNFNNNGLIDMKSFFSECESLEKLILSNFNINNVTDLSNMIIQCNLLKEIYISNFNAVNVTNMRSMFYGNRNLQKLIISNFNTNNATDMSLMFYECSSLKELNLSNLNTNNAINMSYMFSE